MFKTDDIVMHPRFGEGRVRVNDGETVIVRFHSGLEECLATQLQKIVSPTEKIRSGTFDETVPTMARVMASCIRSIHDEWGIFANSRISLLPHQLWVCRQVLEYWPMRWLVADDVGLGKTIEAGLILSSLTASQKLRRLLILAPASLVGQWQQRMLDMFDIRLTPYSPKHDTPRMNFWSGSRYVVASMETLRTNTRDRWKRLVDSDTWDLIMVDEAHRMNADERSGATLSYELLAELEKHKKIHSMIFFTGTPHRGKDYGFLSLLKLLRPDVFDPEIPLERVLDKLPDVVIRNNKQKVTDMKGDRLFTPVHTHKIHYTYSAAEAHFYDQLTDFILSGRAYAQNLAAQQQRIMIFVLYTMQKLASSSISAIKNALKNRIWRLEYKENNRQTLLDNFLNTIGQLEKSEQECEDSAHENALQHVSDVHEEIQFPDEITFLKVLLSLAEGIGEETKITTIVNKIRDDFTDESVLFFTEYKATQALLISALRVAFGKECATFINGDGALTFEGTNGEKCIEHMTRDRAATLFNSGKVRFLVSTEAAGEGIDLQENCHTLFHVDLPWNPMRLHQRVGRVSRYGQKHPVDVYIFRNPDTVESHIWECLEAKLQRITLAFQGAMEDPEDMCQAVIGMSSANVFTNLFSDAPQKSRAGIKDWFDAKTASFGGQDVISLVKRMFGSVKRFDFGTVEYCLPRVDLADLIPYFKLSLVQHKRNWKEEEPHKLIFKTPESWRDDLRIIEEYQLIFSREATCNENEDIAGMGLAIVNRAVDDSLGLKENICILHGIEAPLFVYRMRDRSTDTESRVRHRIVGVEKTLSGWHVYKDWELLLRLNEFTVKPRSLLNKTYVGVVPSVDDFAGSECHLMHIVDTFNVPFKVPYLELVACFCPAEN